MKHDAGESTFADFCGVRLQWGLPRMALSIAEGTAVETDKGSSYMCPAESPEQVIATAVLDDLQIMH